MNSHLQDCSNSLILLGPDGHLKPFAQISAITSNQAGQSNSHCSQQCLQEIQYTRTVSVFALTGYIQPTVNTQDSRLSITWQASKSCTKWWQKMKQPPGTEGWSVLPQPGITRTTLSCWHLSAQVTGTAAPEGASKHHLFKQLLFCSKQAPCPAVSLNCSLALEQESASNWRVPKCCNELGWLSSPVTEMQLPLLHSSPECVPQALQTTGKGLPRVKLAATGGAGGERTAADSQECSFPAHSKETRLLTPHFALDSSGSSTAADHRRTLETGSSLQIFQSKILIKTHQGVEKVCVQLLRAWLLAWGPEALSEARPCRHSPALGAVRLNCGNSTAVHILTFTSRSALAWVPLAPGTDPQGPLATRGNWGWLIRPVLIWDGIWLCRTTGSLWTVLVNGALTNGGSRLGWERI